MNDHNYDKYMFITENINHIFEETQKQQQAPQKQQQAPQTPQKQQQTPHKQPPRPISHPIFWSLYAIINVNNILAKYGDALEEMNFRITFVETIKANIGWLKQNKMKVAEIEQEALNNTDLQLFGVCFKAICAYYKLYIVVIRGNVWASSMDDDDLPQTVMEWNDTLRIYETHTNNEIIKEKMDKMRCSGYKYTKPLKAIGSFKVDELREMYMKVVGGEITEPATKKDLYAKITAKLCF